MTSWTEAESALTVTALVGSVLGVPAALYWLSKRFATRAAVHQMTLTFEAYLKKHDKDHDEIELRLNAGEIRFGRLDERMAALPTKEDIAKLRVDIAGLTATVAANTENNKALQAEVVRLVQHHMKEAR